MGDEVLEDFRGEEKSNARGVARGGGHVEASI